MKKTIMLIMGMMTVCLSCIAQVGGARINQWIYGLTGVPNPFTQRIYFGNGLGVLENYDYGCGFAAYGGVCISDLGGTIQFVTNGVVVMDAQGDTVQSAIDYNPAYWNPVTDPIQGNSPTPLVLPDPSNPLRYYLLHYNTRNTNLATAPNCCWAPTLLSPRYSIIDMSSGIPVMTVKNEILYQDSFQIIHSPQFQATKHANGRDWWLLMPRQRQDSILTFLLSPNGISQPFVQSGLGAWTMFPTSLTEDSYCFMRFSPDGSKLGVNWSRNGMSVYDFDRCTGMLSNRIPINDIIPYDSTFNSGNHFIFSPDSKLLYLVSASKRMYQYRMDTTDINASAIMLRDSLHPDFGIASLAISHEEIPRLFCFRGGGAFIDIIPSPNVRGLDCGFIEEGYSSSSPLYPNIYLPNYSLGPLVGSGCDTLTSSISPYDSAQGTVLVYPNPTDGEITVTFESKYGHSGRFMCYNPLGQVCKAIDLAHSPSKVSLSDLPAGLYYWEFEGQKGKLWVK